MPPHETVWTIVVGGGSGSRFGKPKQYEVLAGRRVIDHAVAVARSVSHGVVVVVPPDDAEREGGVPGGATRAESVRAGLATVPADATIVVVHDAARPLATADLFHRVIDAVSTHRVQGAVPGVPVTDTIKVVDAHGGVVSTPARSSLVAVQTPQAFDAEALREAHAGGGEGTDDAELLERIGARVRVVEGEPDNFKITLPDDLHRAEAVLLARGGGSGGASAAADADVEGSWS